MINVTLFAHKNEALNVEWRLNAEKKAARNVVMHEFLVWIKGNCHGNTFTFKALRRKMLYLSSPTRDIVHNF